MMGIAQKVAREFNDSVRSRGQSYFAKNRVVITASSAGEVVARVRGTEKYKVRLRLRGIKLVASCSCPYFGPAGAPCKHLWATVLAADARGLLAAAPARHLRLVTGPAQGPQGQGQGQGQPPPPPQPPWLDGPEGYLPPNVNPNLPPGNGMPGGPPRGYGPNPGQGPNYGPNQGHPGRGQRQGQPRGQQGPNPGPGPNYPSRGPNYGPNQAHGPNPRPPGPGYGPQPRGPAGNGPYRPGPNQPGPGPGQGRPNNPRDRRAARGLNNNEGPGGNINAQHAKLQAQQQARPPARPAPRPPRSRRPSGSWPTSSTSPPPWRATRSSSTSPAGPGGPTATGARSSPGGTRRTSPWSATTRRTATSCSRSSRPQSPPASSGSNGHGDSAGTRRFLLRPEAQAAVVERLARTGRLRLRRADGEDDPPVVRWDDQPPWRFGIDVRCDPTGKRWTWRGMLRRVDARGVADRMDLAEPLALLPGLVVQGVGKLARLDDAGMLPWVIRVRHEKEMAFSDAQAQDAMLEKLLPDSAIPASELIESEVLKLREVGEIPQPCLTLRTPRQNWGTDRLIAELGFDYGGAYIPIIKPGDMAVRTDLNLVVRRQVALEQAAGIQLYELGFKDAKDHLLDPGSLELPAKRVPQVTKELVSAGWRVEAEGKLIRQAGEFKLAVTTGIDWFELGGQVDFGGQAVELPDLLAAARRGETMISLGDGSMGMLPEDWLRKYGMLADLGAADDASGPIRFGKAQAGLLDALLASQPEIKLDIGFGKVRQALPKFEGVVPKEAPPGFRGELRPYQREGLGWLEYLQKFDFGGILADDMGLGKTVQVLALLQSRRARRQSRGPSLIVVPRSLVFNWMQEAEKFCPRLRVLDYTGPNRHALREDFPSYDLIVTTYGTLRTDIVDLSQIMFDYVILDEAQAIKNADSQAAKAARLLQARHRLAMSGTPIENHLGELWSIFEFLNPGMLGTASVFKKYATGASAADEGARSLLARALRPFILRRTKSQVVKDLPEKFEQTLFCDLEPAQRQLYEELKAHYRQALLRKESGEVGTNKIEVLEALLRLRQAACHPGLIDPERSGDPSAKLDMLLPQLAEVAEEGHKVLVFSQFTKFLGLVRDRLDEEGIKYEYLDGRTRNRAERVERFQTDPTIPLFLISLKAGGLGLNLTAAGYVYLLDPWWNPAVEAQAIDRSHRIGQTQQVFAYRLIAKDTVEQKILDLQQKKRDLADAILDENRNVIGTLTRDDLEFLLS